MIGGVTLDDNGAAGAIEAKINAAIGSIDGTVIEILPAGKRGQSTNATIANVLKGQQRNPFYLDEQAKEAIRFAARGLTAAQYAVRKRAAELMGEVMLLGIARNVDKQRNENGSGFRALTSKYAAYKRRVHGFVTPITRATGDLMDNLKVRISKIR